MLTNIHNEDSLFLHDSAGSIRLMRASGPALCLASAATFGVMGIFGKLAYRDGATVGTLLATRFVVAALACWLVLAGLGRLGELRALGRRDLALALALGAIGYGAQAGSYFLALRRMDASLLAMLVYTFPTIVTVAAIAIGRERASRRTAVALVLASTGLALVLAGGAAGGLDPLGTLLGLTAASVYSVYILSAEGISTRVGPLALMTLVCTGAAISLSVAALLLSDLHPGAVTVAGFGWLVGIGVVSTVIAVGLFFAGLRRVGPSAAAILSTVEPVVTVGLAFMVFGENPGAAALVGGLLVLAAVPALQARRRRSLLAA
jgi:drug/metabolite transporter (DMT)-like permease